MDLTALVHLCRPILILQQTVPSGVNGWQLTWEAHLFSKVISCISKVGMSLWYLKHGKYMQEMMQTFGLQRHLAAEEGCGVLATP